jgi:hypothetical protein
MLDIKCYSKKLEMNFAGGNNNQRRLELESNNLKLFMNSLKKNYKKTQIVIGRMKQEKKKSYLSFIKLQVKF